MLQAPRFASLLTLACSLFLLSGCGKKTVTVKGNLVLPANFKVEKEDSVQIAFMPEEGGAAKTAIFQTSDNSFEAKGVPVGKNKVTVTMSPYKGLAGSEKRGEALEATINKVFGDTKKTPLTYDTPAEPREQTVTIDLSKKTVTSK
jgi:hypothetical protein